VRVRAVPCGEERVREKQLLSVVPAGEVGKVQHGAIKGRE
jgi:hypothetical protein